MVLPTKNLKGLQGNGDALLHNPIQNETVREPHYRHRSSPHAHWLLKLHTGNIITPINRASSGFPGYVVLSHEPTNRASPGRVVARRTF